MISDVWHLGSKHDQNSQGSPPRDALRTFDINGPKVNQFGQKIVQPRNIPQGLAAGQLESMPRQNMIKNESQAFRHENPTFDKHYDQLKEN
jgi:hypothetical protein